MKAGEIHNEPESSSCEPHTRVQHFWNTLGQWGTTFLVHHRTEDPDTLAVIKSSLDAKIEPMAICSAMDLHLGFVFSNLA